MPSAHLDNLVRVGHLAAESPSESEFNNRKRSGKAQLTDAMNMALSIETRFSVAYNAAYAFSLAALRWHAYRPKNRYVVFQCLEHTLNLPPEQWRVLAKAHEKRNLAEYQGHFEVDEHLLAALIRVTKEVSERLDRLEPL